MKTWSIILMSILLASCGRDYEKNPLTAEEKARIATYEAENFGEETGTRWSIRRPGMEYSFNLNEFTPKESPHMSCIVVSRSGVGDLALNCFPKEKK